MHDPKCYELAVLFLNDKPELNTEERRQGLANIIQDAIEDHLACLGLEVADAKIASAQGTESGLRCHTGEAHNWQKIGTHRWQCSRCLRVRTSTRPDLLTVAPLAQVIEETRPDLCPDGKPHVPDRQVCLRCASKLLK